MMNLNKKEQINVLDAIFLENNKEKEIKQKIQVK